MALMLGIDTGGTFTDAVLLDDDQGGVVASAKAPTTHHDLTIGLAAAVRQVLAVAGNGAAQEVGLVSVSTTLATNALVEGHGEPAALFTFGFSPRELERSGIDAAVDVDLRVHFDGGHDAHGNEIDALDDKAIARVARSFEDRVAAFAVAAQFSVRNPRHELLAAAAIREATGLPVTASHELSARLDGPRRALTAVLNARLLGTIDRLDRAVVSVLAANEIDAPLMIVRGDGSLVSSAFARRRPIETILSGPAASVIGALHLAGVGDGVVVDIGGTTTDVAVIANGRPSISPNGAVVGSHRTMIEAVDLATVGLGGDSEVRIDGRHALGPLLLGPARAVSISRLALEFPVIHDMLDRQLGAAAASANHGRFLVSTAPPDVRTNDARESAVLSRLTNGPVPVTDAATSGLEQRAAARLQSRGLVRIATMTPTDAWAVLGSMPEVDGDAAHKVASLLARNTNSTGRTSFVDGVALAAAVIERLTLRSAEFVVRAALAADGVDLDRADGVMAAALARHRGTASVRIGLSSPLVAIGAPAAAFYQQVAARIDTTAIVPENADVANAVGAIVGRVRVRRSATITQPTRGQFRVHLGDQPTFGSVANARACASERLRTWAFDDAEAAGAASPELSETWSARTAVVNDREVFVEGRLTIEASGRPRF